jgi:NADPH:quinone reductase-like Zn-dependent oxidoreductase
MEAAVYTQYGPPEIVQVMEVKKPIPKNNEVLVKVHATTVNRTDCGFRSAEYFIVRFFSGLLKPKNKILGIEFAGKIEAIGAAIKDFKVGDNVFGYNDETFGAHAEFMVMKAHKPMSIMP